MRKKIVLFLGCCLISFSGWTDAIILSYHLSEKCPADKPFLGSYGGCRGCDELESLMLDDEEDTANFEVCQNREIVKVNDWGPFRSRLKKCPTSYPVRDLWDNCVSCDNPQQIIIRNEKDCKICSERKTEKWMDNDYSCYLTKCSEKYPLYDNKECLACDAPYWTHNDKETCEKCPNRQYIPSGITLYTGVNEHGDKIVGKTLSGCYLKQKIDGLPLFEIDTKTEVVEPNPQKEGKRIYIGSVKFYPHQQHVTQHFWSCDEAPDNIQTLPEVCAKCPNREYMDGKCILKKEGK